MVGIGWMTVGISFGTALLTSFLTIGGYKLQLRWESLMKIKQSQFDHFIRPAFELIQPILNPYAGVGIVEFYEADLEKKSSVLYHLAKLAHQERQYVNDSFYWFVINMAPDSTDFELDFLALCKEIVRLYFLWKSTVEIPDRLPFKVKWRVIRKGGAVPELSKQKMRFRKIVAFIDLMSGTGIFKVLTGVTVIFVLLYLAALTEYVLHHLR